MDIQQLWQAWPVAGPWQIFPMVGGTNTLIWRALAADGQQYALRIIPNLARISHLRYEASLLEALAATQPPVQLPLLLRARDGDSIVECELEGKAALATLSPLLSGRLPDLLPDRHDPSIAVDAAQVLAWLDTALAQLSPQSLAGSPQLPTFGTLKNRQGPIEDPLVCLQQLPAAPEKIQQLSSFLEEVIELVPGLYRRLPQQILHRDYDPANILAEGQRVTAVLDFELAGPDLRALDLCGALSWWPVQLLGSGQEWALMETFATAYLARFPLSEEELLALPDLCRMRDATSLVQRVGRYLTGQESEGVIQRRVEHSLWREAWIVANRQTLQEHALTWRHKATAVPSGEN
ncbi:hypothetical protein EPA93_09530 [Ktedonosporobacter rubrisoli]|uniref:Aminoglycoside phosphotransferase domain-containing protein n=1 Tax=Ktedonosporobacter rubrisoli TaxID=2509675 RepID=A0A4P6JLX8_KTERU|nr:phosphotransferase [Ktedonosporobacter rubrisoli]QBD76238.1 hypothetical protein EPA93_09530 [Ktedonosporobacter rubrisoli]